MGIARSSRQEACHVCCSRQFHFQLGAGGGSELAAEAVKLAAMQRALPMLQLRLHQPRRVRSLLR